MKIIDFFIEKNPFSLESTLHAKIKLDPKDSIVYGISGAYIQDYRDEKAHGALAVKSIYTNPPYTTVLWGDDTRTTVKCCETDTYSVAQGFAAALAKKLYGGDEGSSSAVKKFVAAHTKDSTKKAKKKPEDAQ